MYYAAAPVAAAGAGQRGDMTSQTRGTRHEPVHSFNCFICTAVSRRTPPLFRDNWFSQSFYYKLTRRMSLTFLFEWIEMDFTFISNSINVIVIRYWYVYSFLATLALKMLTDLPGQRLGF